MLCSFFINQFCLLNYEMHIYFLNTGIRILKPSILSVLFYLFLFVFLIFILKFLFLYLLQFIRISIFIITKASNLIKFHSLPLEPSETINYMIDNNYNISCLVTNFLQPEFLLILYEEPNSSSKATRMYLCNCILHSLSWQLLIKKKNLIKSRKFENCILMLK